jgi:hypothetical protein
LRDKFKKLIPLFDRLNYECGEVNKSAAASEQTTRHLLYLNKSKRLYAEDSQRAGEFLKAFCNEYQEDKGGIVHFMHFCIKYIESSEVKDRAPSSINVILLSLGFD